MNGPADPSPAGDDFDPEADGGETLVTEINILPDGRVYVFGTSRQVLEVLESLDPDNPKLRRLLGHVRSLEASERGPDRPKSGEK